MRWLLMIGVFVTTVAVASAGDALLQKDIDLVLKQGRGTFEGRAAWDRLALAKPEALPQLLEAMGAKDTVAANWIRTVIDQIVEREKKIDSTKLLAFVKDGSKPGRARRYALELVEQGKPGASKELYPLWLDDAEFRFEAVGDVLERAGAAAKAKNDLIAVNLYRQAFEKSRDIQQARDAAAGLPEKERRSVAEHLGFFLDWHLIGPFDGKGQKGVHLSYPPEKKVDLTEELDGQNSKVRWKPFRVKETFTGRHQALVDLRSKAALGDADDAVAFAYTEFTIAKAMNAEMRGAADDNLVVYVNGVKAFGFEEWRNGVRHDRHRFAVKLQEGKNSVLVKISQSAAPNTEPNWEFFLRVVDVTGKGIALKK